jgi:hypothetical protein
MRAPGVSSRARFGKVVGRDGDDRASLQKDGLALLEQPGADFGALQVLEDANSVSLTLGGTAQTLDVVGVIFVAAVRKVEAGDIHAETE